MSKCFSSIFSKFFLCSCFCKRKNQDDYLRFSNPREELTTLKNSNPNIKIYQLSSSNDFVPQGDICKMENYDIFYSFLCKPLVKIYLEEIFRPNKEIKSFQIPKVKGIFEQIQPEINALLSRLNMELHIPEEKYFLSTLNFDLESNPASEEDLDLYSPMFLMEFWFYGKSFIRNSGLKKIILVHDIKFKTASYIQERTGCPEYSITKSLILATKERNFAYIRIVLHHEFFHYVDWADDKSFNDDEWNNLNQAGFKYGKGGDSERNWIKLEKNVKGFINHYSTTALEEDRAEIYQYLIGCPDEALNNKDIIVRKKAKRIQNFINSFDKSGIGNFESNFWANLIDYRNKYPYKEAVFQGNISH